MKSVSITKFCLSFVFFSFSLSIQTVSAQWKDQFPATPFETVTKEKIKSLEASIKTLVPTCMDRLETILGKKWKRNKRNFPKRLRVSVLPPGVSTELEGFAETSGDFFISMDFNPLFFLSGHTDLETTVCHESVHAYYRYHLNMAEYAAIPRWVREGSAVYLANQLPHKESRSLLDKILKDKNPINGLEGNHTFQDYFEDGLAFLFLKQKYSADISTLGLLLEGKEIFEAIQKTTGLSRQQFLADVKSYSEEHVTQKIRGLEATTTSALGLYQNQSTRNQSGPLFYNIIKGNMNSTSKLDFGLAAQASLELYGSPVKAPDMITLYSEVLAKVPSFYYGLNSGVMRYKLGGLFHEVENFEQSLHYYTLVFNENAELPILQQSSTAGILRAYVGLKNWKKVIDWSKREKGLHVSNIVEYRYYRGLAYQGLGNLSKARELFESACSSANNRNFKEKACLALQSI